MKSFDFISHPKVNKVGASMHFLCLLDYCIVLYLFRCHFRWVLEDRMYLLFLFHWYFLGSGIFAPVLTGSLVYFNTDWGVYGKSLVLCILDFCTLTCAALMVRCSFGSPCIVISIDSCYFYIENSNNIYFWKNTSKLAPTGPHWGGNSKVVGPAKEKPSPGLPPTKSAWRGGGDSEKAPIGLTSTLSNCRKGGVRMESI